MVNQGIKVVTTATDDWLDKVSYRALDNPIEITETQGILIEATLIGTSNGYYFIGVGNAIDSSTNNAGFRVYVDGVGEDVILEYERDGGGYGADDVNIADCTISHTIAALLFATPRQSLLIVDGVVSDEGVLPIASETVYNYLLLDRKYNLGAGYITIDKIRIEAVEE